MKHWLIYLGKRRPTSLADQGQFSETVSRPKAEPKAHKNPKGIDGQSLGGRKAKGKGKDPKGKK